MKVNGKSVGRMMGLGILIFTLGLTVSAHARGEANKPTADQQTADQRSKLEQAQAAHIPNVQFRARFGREHTFHLDESAYGQDRRFEVGGYAFAFVDEWPTNWQATEDLFVIQADGGYFLCNRTYPGVNIPLSVAP